MQRISLIQLNQIMQLNKLADMPAHLYNQWIVLDRNTTLFHQVFMNAQRPPVVAVRQRKRNRHD